MDDFTSRQLIEKIEYALKEVIDDVLNNSDTIDNLEQVIAQKVHTKIGGLSRSLSFSFSIPNGIEVKDIYYTAKTSNNGIIKGDISIEHCEKQDIHKYGGPGYPGKEDGQLCEYPVHSGEFYKWNEFFCQWEDIYKDIDRGNDRQSWHDKLMNNAAFEPWWGNNNSGGNYLRSDRKRNGADDLWGDPGVRSYMGTFKQISADVMKSVYRFTLNLKSAIGHYEKLSDAFGFGDEDEEKNITSEVSKRGIEDTTTHVLTGDVFEMRTSREVNGFISEIMGYKNAQRDSAYHVSQAKLKGNIRMEITIKKKYE